MEWLYHKKPLFLMHWKDGKVPQSVQDKVVVIPGGDALKSPIAAYHETTSAPATPKASQIVHQHARPGSSWKPHAPWITAMDVVICNLPDAPGSTSMHRR